MNRLLKPLAGVERSRESDHDARPPGGVQATLEGPAFVSLIIGIAIILLWSYAGSFYILGERWLTEPDYSHGFIVPFFSIFLLWRRRELLTLTPTVSPSAVLTGCLLVVLAGLMRWIGIYQQFDLLGPTSLLPALMGVCLVVGGWSWGKWCWPAVLFLIFMIPLPGFISGQLSHPLQRIGTILSTFSLQTLGIPAIARGNVIYLTEARIGVVEACSGLRMLNVFFAITIGASFILKRPLWEKAVLVLSAPLIGVVTNVMRITITGIAHEFFSRELADHLFHDLAGLLMMPIAIGLLMVEAWLLKRLWIEEDVDGKVDLGFGDRKRLHTGEAT